MKKRVARWQFLILILFATALALPASELPQQRDRERDRDSDEADINRRSFNLRMLHIMAKQKGPRKKNPQLALAQLQEDFVRIQILNKPLGLAALGSGNLDLKFVTKSTIEINKRAERLKENLALPIPVQPSEPIKEYRVGNASQLKVPIVDMARLILDFTDNPFFKEASVLETQQAEKARRDLDEIIRLSEAITNFSQKLRSGAPP
jgi:hypothetical protein